MRLIDYYFLVATQEKCIASPSREPSSVDEKLAELLDQMQSTLVRLRPKSAEEIVQKTQGHTVYSKPSESPTQGEDIEVALSITSQEATMGTSKEITFKYIEYPNGTLKSGRRENKTLTVKIPPASTNGSVLRLVGQGNDGLNGGNRGNVHVRLNVAKDYPPQSQPSNVVYASLGRRSIAFASDMLLAAIVLGIAIYFRVNPNPIIAGLLGSFIASEASGGTPGKQLMAVAVTNKQGLKISHGKSIARNFIKYASIACFGIGIAYFILTGLFSRKKLALHDLLTGCIVVRV